MAYSPRSLPRPRKSGPSLKGAQSALARMLQASYMAVNEILSFVGSKFEVLNSAQQALSFGP
jgi:hypothetical protein